MFILRFCEGLDTWVYKVGKINFADQSVFSSAFTAKLSRGESGFFMSSKGHHWHHQFSEEHRRKLSLANKGQIPWSKGKIFTPRIKKVCKICGKIFYITIPRAKTDRGIYCNIECFKRFVHNNHLSRSTEFKKGHHFLGDKKFWIKKGQFVNEKHPFWKGDNVGYGALHEWVTRHRGKPKKCEFCGSTQSVQWANKSGEYKRNINDWLRLCVPCHRTYDHKNQHGQKIHERWPLMKRVYNRAV